MKVDRSLFQTLMPEKQLNCAQVGACFEYVRGKAMPQRIIAMLMNFTQRRSAIAITLSTE